MGKIYRDQTSLKIILTTNVDITGALEKKIKYIKPDGTTDSLNAEVQDAATGIIYYDLEKTDTFLDQPGTWMFYAYIKFSDERIACGESVGVRVYDAGE